MAKITGGELIVRCLANEGIKFIFGLPTPEIDPILAKLDGYGIRFVPVRHEAAAVHMAEGLYRSTGQVAAVFGNPGPGSANLLPGVITAKHEGVPVLVVTEQHRLGLIYPSTPATFQGQDQLEAFKSTVKWGASILLWNRIPEIMRLAFREMWIGRPGPVQIDLPVAVVYEEGDETEAPIVKPTQYRAPQPQPSQGQTKEAVDLLVNAKHPLIFSGAGVDRAGANKALREIVELLNCPVIRSFAGRSTIPGDHPNYIEAFGHGGDVVKQEADVILVAGSRLGNLDLPYDKYWGKPANHKIIQIDIDQRNMGVTRPITLGIVADVKSSLEILVSELKAAKVQPKDGKDLARYRQISREWQEERFRSVKDWTGLGIHPAHAAQLVGKVFGKHACYHTDGGNSNLWMGWYLPATRPRSFHNINEFGMLGTGIPSAIGAKLGDPSREVVCTTGDGAAGFNFMEMQTAARENLNITVVVFAEGAWTMEEPNQLHLYGRTFGTAMGTVRWDKVGEGLGCHGQYVERIEELEPALIRAKENEGPSVVCVKTDHEANLNIHPDFMKRFMEVYAGPIE